MKNIFNFNSFSTNEEWSKNDPIPMVKESIDNKQAVDEIIENMLDFIDEGENISFYSTTGNMTYADYLEKNQKYEKFQPVIKGGNKIISKFSILYRPNKKNYHGVVELMENMNTTIGRLGESGWVLYDLNLKSNTADYGKPVEISYVEFTFTKPDVFLAGEEFRIPDEDELREKIEELGIPVRDVETSEHEAVVEFGSYGYNEELNSERWYDEQFRKIVDIFGFSSYDLWYSRAKVTFEY